ncbi:MAG: efflux RND transporter periplasmic adaptor subunit [Chitinophagales bacterium]|nr:efflux RND transporter periplasmic adaptor subunit [Chitinophagaceae bacterium]MCB9064984.1 efflux RND transporter periplasmic adaptor subunit [Chitinophagales bacterium]
MNKFIVFIGLCAIMLNTSCKSHKKEQEIETSFMVTSPLRIDTSVTKEYVCQIRSISHIEIMAQERGYLENIYIDEGQHVKKGQPLFKIMPKLYEAEYKRAQAEAKVAEIEYLNTKALADSNIVSPNELAMAKAKYDKANAELALADVHLQFTIVNAPFDGIIDRFHVRLGSLIDEGELLTTLSDNSEMWVYFNVPEVEYLEFKSKVKNDSLMKVNLLMANNEVFPYTGIVETIEADFNNETGNIAFRATFPNPNGLLRHGETGNILMPVPLRNALIIPQKATFEIMDKKFVFVVDKNDVVKQKEIKIGQEMTDLCAVTWGLNDGDRILLEGLRKVKDGDKISFEYEEPREVMSHLKLFTE